MTINRTYQCNLCHTYIDAPYGGVEAGVSLYWKSTAGSEVIEFRKVHDTEHHVCNKCASAIHDYWKGLGQ